MYAQNQHDRSKYTTGSFCFLCRLFHCVGASSVKMTTATIASTSTNGGGYEINSNHNHNNNNNNDNTDDSTLFRAPSAFENWNALYRNTIPVEYIIAFVRPCKIDAFEWNGMKSACQA